MIELEEPQSHAKNNGKIKVYEGKDVDLIWFLFSYIFFPMHWYK